MLYSSARREYPNPSSERDDIEVPVSDDKISDRTLLLKLSRLLILHRFVAWVSGIAVEAVVSLLILPRVFCLYFSLCREG